jgi:hypothetical protein
VSNRLLLAEAVQQAFPYVSIPFRPLLYPCLLAARTCVTNRKGASPKSWRVVCILESPDT